MNKTRLIALLLAIGAAGGAAMLMKNLTAQNTAQPQAVVREKVEKADVLTVAKDIGQGQKISAKALAWTPWPKNMVTDFMVTRTSQPDALEKFAGKRSLAKLYAGEPFLPKKALSSTDGGVLAAMLPKGMRAISVGISVTTGAGGFIMPNDRVDVLLTRTIGERKITDVVLSNVRVLAIDQMLQTGKDGEETASSEIKTATLELKPHQAEILAKAESMGQLSLALRSAKEGESKLGDAGPRLSPKYARSNGGEVRILRFGVPRTQASN